MMLSLAVLCTALLFGGMTLYSFGFAAFLFTALSAKTAGEALRRGCARGHPGAQTQRLAERHQVLWSRRSTSCEGIL